MKAFPLVVCVLLALGLMGRALGQGEEELVTVEYQVPPAFFSANEKGDYLAGVKEIGLVEGLGMPLRAYDVKASFEAWGLTFPEGAKALFFPEQSFLLFRNTRGNVDLLMSLNDCKWGISFYLLQTEYFLVSYVSPGGGVEKEMTYEQLREAAGTSWKMEKVLSCSGKSGMRSSAAIAGEMETQTEGVIGPDGVTIEVNYSCAFQAQDGDGQALNLSAKGIVTTTSGLLKVLSIKPAETVGKASYAVLLRASAQDPGNVTRLPEAVKPTLP